MARTARTKTPDTPAEAAPLMLAAQPSTGVRRQRTIADAPLLSTVSADLLATLQNGAMAYTVTGVEQLKKLTSLLARARKQNEIGLRQSTTDNGDGTFTVDFEATPTPRKRNYTAQDIRNWWMDTYGEEIVGKIPERVRTAYRDAHGYNKSSKGEE